MFLWSFSIAFGKIVNTYPPCFQKHFLIGLKEGWTSKSSSSQVKNRLTHQHCLPVFVDMNGTRQVTLKQLQLTSHNRGSEQEPHRGYNCYLWPYWDLSSQPGERLISMGVRLASIHRHTRETWIEIRYVKQRNKCAYYKNYKCISEQVVTN